MKVQRDNVQSKEKESCRRQGWSEKQTRCELVETSKAADGRKRKRVVKFNERIPND